MTALTPSIQFHTKSFFVFPDQDEKGNVFLNADPTKHVIIESCSELMQYNFLGSTFSADGAIRYIHDSQGQPMVFSIGTDKHLYALVYVNAASRGWRAFDITPELGLVVHAFDVLKNDKNVLVIVASRATSTKIHQVSFPLPQLLAESDGKISGSVFENLRWNSIEQNLGQYDVSTLVCGHFRSEETDVNFRIVAGVKATERKEASHYLYSSKSPNIWTRVPLPQSAKVILECQPASLPQPLAQGHFLLLEGEEYDKPVTCLFQGNGVAKQMFLTGLSGAKSICSSINCKGYTDLLVATDSGIGFFDHVQTQNPLKVLVPGVSFKNVFCSEYSTEDAETSTLAVFALSSRGELYFCEGIRNIAERRSFKWNESGVPIRTGICRIAGQLNPSTGASELAYVTDDKDEIRYLSRDYTTSMWKESQLLVNVTAKKPASTKAWACVTTLSFSDPNGNPVPPRYPVHLTSEPTLVLINDRSFNLDERPRELLTDEFGQLRIVVPMHNSLSAAPIGISLRMHTPEPEIFYVQPAQRVIHQLSKVKDSSDIANARRSDGIAIFTDLDKEKKKDRFDDAANLLSLLPDAFSHVAPGVSKRKILNDSDIILTWDKAPNGNSKSTDTTWLSEAVDGTAEVLGDIIEFMKKAVKAVVKIALKVAGPVVLFIIKIAARTIRFVLDSVSKLVNCVADFLESTLELDMSGLRNWFGFHYKKVAQTQREVEYLLNMGLKLTSRFFHENRKVLVEGIDVLGETLEQYVSLPTLRPDKTPEKGSIVSRFLNNPIVVQLLKFNPIGWIGEAIQEELGDSVKIPSLDLGIGQAILASLMKHIEMLWKLLERARENLGDAVRDPSIVVNKLLDTFRVAFWNVFATVKQIILDTFDLLLGAFDKFIAFLNAEWVIPELTELWSELTGCKFTIINFVAYFIAQVTELFNTSDKPYFDRLLIRESLDDVDKKPIPLLFDIKKEKSRHKQNGANSGQPFKNPYGSNSTPRKDEPRTLSKSMTASSSAYVNMYDLISQKELPSKTMAPPMAAYSMMESFNPGIVPMNMTVTKKKTPSSTAKWLLVFFRTGKNLSRCASVTLEGLMPFPEQGFVPGGEWEDPARTDLQLADPYYPGTNRTISSIDLDESETFDLDDLPDMGREGGVPPFNKLIAASNLFGLVCRAVELLIIAENFDEEDRKGENWEGNCYGILGALVGFLTSAFFPSKVGICIGNIANNIGTLTGALLAPERDAAEKLEIAGSVCNTVASIGFLVKDPYSIGQVVAWISTVSDIGCSIAVAPCAKSELDEKYKEN